MAVLDDLVSQVPDRALRERLQKAVGDLRKRQKFGLVFEEHIPETTAIHGLPIQVGALVQRRQDPDGKIVFKVAHLKDGGKRAVIVAPDGHEETLRSGDLLTVKRFGEPMYAALTPVGAIRHGPEDRPHHAVINGENFHTLQLFAYLYERSVDCIYIDPPYNTGARDWKYNNRFVDANDSWRHSKWLSMVHKRLRLARRLLKPDGVLIVMIDEHEVHHLGVLLERADLFPKPDYLRQMVTIVINPKGTAKTNFSRVEEHALFVMPNIGRNVIADRPVESRARGARDNGSGTASLWDEVALDDGDGADAADEGVEETEEAEALAATVAPEAEVEWRHARRRGAESSYRPQRPNQFYPIYVDEKARRVVRAGPSIPLEAEPNFEKIDGLVPVWPIDKNGDHRCWSFVSGSMQKLIDSGRVRANYSRGNWTLNYAVPRKATRKWKTVWWDSLHDAGTHGTELLRKLLGRPGLFPFPKSVYATRDCLAAVVADRPDALVLDFFAGSGTTLHSVCMLNAADGGRRRCILVTNNEVEEKTARRLMREGLAPGDREFEQHGIFEQVTRPRVAAVVRGVRPDGKPIPKRIAGFPENVEFFRLAYLDPDTIELGEQFEAVAHALWLAAGGIGQLDDIPKRSVDFYIPRNSPFGVLFKASRLRRFLATLAKRPDVTHVWVVTDSEEAYAEACEALPQQVRFTSQLYRDYLRTFRINAEPE